MAYQPTVPGSGDPNEGTAGEGGPISQAPSNTTAPGGGPGNCPGGQVWHAWPAPGRCEAPDALSKADKDTCDEANHPEPRDCYWCNFDTQQWERGWCGETKGGGGGGGGPKPASSGGGAGAGGLGSGGLESDAIWQSIMGRLKGDTRYTPEVMSAMQGQTKMTAEAQKVNDSEEALANMARRGVARSPYQNATFRDINARSSAMVLDEQNKLSRAKIDADYQDKSEAINEGMQWLNSLRDYTARMTSTQASKDASMAQISLGYAQLQQQMAMMKEQYAQQVSLLVLGGGTGR